MIPPDTAAVAPETALLAMAAVLVLAIMGLTDD